MDYITRFYTTAEFTTAEPNLARPHVSLTKDNYVVHYMPVASQGGSGSGSGSDDGSNGHDYVEIGGIKWATMNVGANSVTDYGLYFQWGDTQGYTAEQVGDGEGQKYFGDDDCIYYNDGSYTKYNSDDGLITLQATNDAVKAAWGGNWRMPTVSEFIALGEAVTSAWTADYQGSGVAGVVLTSIADGATLFFPACGNINYGSVNDVNSYGNYWSSSLDASFGDNSAYNLSFDNSNVSWDSNDYYRYYGYPVRGVLG